MHRPLCILLLLPLITFAQHEHHEARINRDSIVMNENRDRLPHGCAGIAADRQFTIRAGRNYAADAPGIMFGMDLHEISVEPCSRIEVTFINEDEVRHQWMVHGLPKYLYPAGMFHMEAMGGQTVTGTFIVPPEDRNYLVHCDMAQHMEKGMRGQVIVGKGSGDLWGIKGISDAFYRSSYLPRSALLLVAGMLLLGFVVAALMRRRQRHS